MKIEPVSKDEKCEFCGEKASYYVEVGDKKVAVCDKCLANL